jgi:hypothetical protein
MKLAAITCLTALVMVAGCEKKPEGPLVPADYRTWRRVPSQPLRSPVPGHLDSTRVVYINPTGLKAITSTRGERVVDDYPRGTIIVKEVFPSLQADVGGVPPRLTVMIKNPGHKLARGGWVWILAEPPRGTERVIDYEFCFECHTDANEAHPYGDGNPGGEFRDYVFFPYKLER